MQAGLPPKMEGSLYVDLTRALKEAAPELHIHGFLAGGGLVRRDALPLLDSGLPARIARRRRRIAAGHVGGDLDQRVRDEIAPGRITVEQWTDVIATAHRLGVPTTSTIMFGHVETNEHRAAHLALLRDMQKATGGFTEFVPLSFVHEEAPMFAKSLRGELRPGATGAEVVRMHAIARLMLHGWIDNIQCSWVKEGPKLAQLLLLAGCNDVGGTLINESISTAAGAPHGQLVPPSELRRWIRDAGRVPVERTTLYETRRAFEAEPDEPEPLDLAAAQPERFGSYAELIKLDAFRYEGQRAPELEGPTLPEALAAAGR